MKPRVNTIIVTKGTTDINRKYQRWLPATPPKHKIIPCRLESSESSDASWGVAALTPPIAIDPVGFKTQKLSKAEGSQNDLKLGIDSQNLDRTTDIGDGGNSLPLNTCNPVPIGNRIYVRLISKFHVGQDCDKRKQTTMKMQTPENFSYSVAQSDDDLDYDKQKQRRTATWITPLVTHVVYSDDNKSSKGALSPLSAKTLQSKLKQTFAPKTNRAAELRAERSRAVVGGTSSQRETITRGNRSSNVKPEAGKFDSSGRQTLDTNFSKDRSIMKDPSGKLDRFINAPNPCVPLNAESCKEIVDGCAQPTAKRKAPFSTGNDLKQESNQRGETKRTSLRGGEECKGNYTAKDTEKLDEVNKTSDQKFAHSNSEQDEIINQCNKFENLEERRMKSVESSGEEEKTLCRQFQKNTSSKSEKQGKVNFKTGSTVETESLMKEPSLNLMHHQNISEIEKKIEEKYICANSKMTNSPNNCAQDVNCQDSNKDYVVASEVEFTTRSPLHMDFYNTISRVLNARDLASLDVNSKQGEKTHRCIRSTGLPKDERSANLELEKEIPPIIQTMIEDARHLACNVEKPASPPAKLEERERAHSPVRPRRKHKLGKDSSKERSTFSELISPTQQSKKLKYMVIQPNATSSKTDDDLVSMLSSMCTSLSLSDSPNKSNTFWDQTSTNGSGNVSERDRGNGQINLQCGTLSPASHPKKVKESHSPICTTQKHDQRSPEFNDKKPVQFNCETLDRRGPNQTEIVMASLGKTMHDKDRLFWRSGSEQVARSHGNYPTAKLCHQMLETGIAAKSVISEMSPDNKFGGLDQISMAVNIGSQSMHRAWKSPNSITADQQREPLSDEYESDTSKDAAGRSLLSYSSCSMVNNDPSQYGKIFSMSQSDYAGTMKTRTPENTSSEQEWTLSEERDTTLKRIFPNESPSTLNNNSSMMLEQESQKALQPESQTTSQHESQHTLKHESQKALPHESQKALPHESQKALQHESQNASQHESQMTLEQDSKKMSENESKSPKYQLLKTPERSITSECKSRTSYNLPRTPVLTPQMSPIPRPADILEHDLQITSQQEQTGKQQKFATNILQGLPFLLEKELESTELLRKELADKQDNDPKMISGYESSKSSPNRKSEINLHCLHEAKPTEIVDSNFKDKTVSISDLQRTETSFTMLWPGCPSHPALPLSLRESFDSIDAIFQQSLSKCVSLPSIGCQGMHKENRCAEMKGGISPRTMDMDLENLSSQSRVSFLQDNIDALLTELKNLIKIYSDVVPENRAMARAPEALKALVVLENQIWHLKDKAQEYGYSKGHRNAAHDLCAVLASNKEIQARHEILLRDLVSAKTLNLELYRLLTTLCPDSRRDPLVPGIPSDYTVEHDGEVASSDGSELDFPPYHENSFESVLGASRNGPARSRLEESPTNTPGGGEATKICPERIGAPAGRLGKTANSQFWKTYYPIIVVSVISVSFLVAYKYILYQFFDSGCQGPVSLLQQPQGTCKQANSCNYPPSNFLSCNCDNVLVEALAKFIQSCIHQQGGMRPQ